MELKDPRAGVLRELREGIGLSTDELEDLQLRYIVLHRLGDEVRQNYYFFARARAGAEITLHSEEGTLAWQELHRLEGLAMPRTVRGMLRPYRSAGRHTRKLYIGVPGKEDVQFSPLEDVGRII